MEDYRKAGVSASVCVRETERDIKVCFLALRLMVIPVFDLSDFPPPTLFEECLFEAVNIANTLLETCRSAWCESIFGCSIDKSLWVVLLNCKFYFFEEVKIFCEVVKTANLI